MATWAETKATREATVGEVIDLTGLRRIPLGEPPGSAGAAAAVEARGRVAAAMRAWCESGSLIDLEAAVDAAVDYRRAADPPGSRRVVRGVAALMAGVTVGLSLITLAGVVVEVLA